MYFFGKGGVVIHKELEKYLPMMDFLSGVLGENAEIVMHDVSDTDKSVVAIRNGHVSGRSVGAPATNLAMKFINDKVYEETPHVINYKGRVQSSNYSKSSTYFIKDDNDQVVGMLCININVDGYIKLRNELDNFINFGNTAHTEEFPNSLEEIANEYIDSALNESGMNPDNMSTDEKINIIKVLNDRDAFSYKGMVFNVAKRLHVSEPTVYRYLNKIKKE